MSIPKPFFAVFLLLAVFSLTQCDLLNISIQPYIDEASSSAGGMGIQITSPHFVNTQGDAESGGLPFTAILPEAPTIITVQLRNPQGHNLELALIDNDGNPVSSSIAIATISSDNKSATVTITGGSRNTLFDYTMTITSEVSGITTEVKLPRMISRHLNANLNSLSVTSVERTDTFSSRLNDPDDKEYEIELEPETASISISAAVPSGRYSSFEIYTRNGNTRAVIQAPYNNIPMEFGTNWIYIDVTADSGEVKTYTLKVNRGLSSTNDIVEFKVTSTTPERIATINGTNINVEVPSNAPLSVLNVEITHNGQSVRLENGSPEIDNPAVLTADFTSPRTFNVIAQDGSQKEYSVTVTVLPAQARLQSDGIDYPTLEMAISYAQDTDTITILSNFTALNGYTIEGKNITLIASAARTITASAGNFTLFTVNASAALTLGGTSAPNNGTITLSGGNEAAQANRRGVHNSGTFTMNSTAVIRSFNNNNTTGGAGVLQSNGTFYMNGGTIGGSGNANINTATNGGGVYVASGVFNMTGNSNIQSNTATNGGGVYVASGTFNMAGSARVTPSTNNTNAGNNDVYLVNEQSISIATSGLAANSGIVARITPQNYSESTQVLTGVDIILNEYFSRFVVTPNASGQWSINSTGYLYPALGSAANPRLINNLADLQNIGAGGTSGTPLGDHYRLMTSTITISGNWTPRGPFTGTFEGNGHTITMNNTSLSGDGGLFGNIGASGIVRNLKFTGALRGINNAATVAYNNLGQVYNISSSVNVSLLNPSATTIRAGGIVVINGSTGTIRNCYSTGNVNATDTFSVTARAGRIAAENASGGIIEYCWASGNVTAESTALQQLELVFAGGIVGTGIVNRCVSLLGTITAGRIGRISVNASGSNNFSNLSGINMNGSANNTVDQGTNVFGGSGGFDDREWWRITADFNTHDSKVIATGVANTESALGNHSFLPWYWDASTNRPRLWFD
ncbi:MAG: DUF5018 domain-containing protein [Treponema sp.]|nr:DUF5018 domain-containing protein [Treponema sp.]